MYWANSGYGWILEIYDNNKMVNIFIVELMQSYSYCLSGYKSEIIFLKSDSKKRAIKK